MFISIKKKNTIKILKKIDLKKKDEEPQESNYRFVILILYTLANSYASFC